MRKKQILLTLASAFLLFGAAMNIMNAINNYGLATNSLHSEILAQTNGDDSPGGDNTGDNTGGGTTTGENGPTPPPNPGGYGPEYRRGYFLDSVEKEEEFVSNGRGEIEFYGEPHTGYLINKKYIVKYLKFFCNYSGNPDDWCNTNEANKLKFIGVKDVDNTGSGSETGTGTGTGDEGNPTVPKP